MLYYIRICTFFLWVLATTFVRADDFVFTPINVSHGLSDNQIRYMLQLPDGRMVFKTSGNLNLYDGTHFTYIHQDSRHIYPINNYDGFYRIYQDGDSLLWIKDEKKLMCVNLYQEKYVPHLQSYFERAGITETVDDLFVDLENRVWLLISDELWLHNNWGKFTKFSIRDNEGILQDVVAEGSDLYLFYNTGAVVCYNQQTRSRRYRCAAYPDSLQDVFKNTSLVVKGNNGFFQLRNGTKGGFFFFDTGKKEWTKLLETDYVLNTLIAGPDGTAYVSCPSGFWKINTRSGSKEHIAVLKTADGNIINTEISTIFSDKQNGLWLGTFNRGLLYYHPQRYRFSYIGRSYFPPPFTKDVIVEGFAEDDDGSIYIACQGGQYFRLAVKGSIRLIPVNGDGLSAGVRNKLQNRQQHPHTDPYGTTFYTDSRGRVWTGTQDGLRLFEQGKKIESVFYTEDGLSNNFVHAILEDRNKSIWITTSYGISRVDSIRNKIHFTNFNIYDGTLEGEYTDGAIFEARDGTLYFGGVNGFNILSPSDRHASGLPFRPVFTNLYLRGEKVEIGRSYNGRIILPVTAPYMKRIELSYNQNFLAFEFSALNYQNPMQTAYRYKLEGVDEDWRMRYAAYTNLAPGGYRLLVMASNNDEWNGGFTELYITIHAPWWKTRLAYVLYILFAALLIASGIYVYIRYTKKKIERQHKEEILLMRIRNLIERCDTLEVEKDSTLPVASDIPESEQQQNTADSEFLSRAIELVERNIDESGYSVEQLSRDLCMDRTGLYRKLVAMLDKSPSLFIRSIRLQKATQLIAEGQLSIMEIADRVGFSSASYMSKCFQEMYGCRPSEYGKKTKANSV
ncbi:MAG: helix-turn-helix domain-containing protein, partial [Mediterranea sp.]|nr:helix-turn-helix domain-containing protein [Mediterranea sp.]